MGTGPLIGSYMLVQCTEYTPEPWDGFMGKLFSVKVQGVDISGCAGRLLISATVERKQPYVNKWRGSAPIKLYL